MWYYQELAKGRGFRLHNSLKDLTPDELYYEPVKSPESLLETIAEIRE